MNDVFISLCDLLRQNVMNISILHIRYLDIYDAKNVKPSTVQGNNFEKVYLVHTFIEKNYIFFITAVLSHRIFIQIL